MFHDQNTDWFAFDPGLGPVPVPDPYAMVWFTHSSKLNFYIVSMRCSATVTVILAWVSLMAGGITAMALADLLWPGEVMLFCLYLYLASLRWHCKYIFGLFSFFYRSITISSKVQRAWMSRVTQRVWDSEIGYTDETHCEFWATVHYCLPRLSHSIKTTPIQGKQGSDMIQNDIEEPTEARDLQEGELVHCKRVKITPAILTAYEEQHQRTIELLVYLKQPSSAASKEYLRDELKLHLLLFCFCHAFFVSPIVLLAYYAAWPSLAAATFCININKDENDACPTSEAGLVGTIFFILPLFFVVPISSLAFLGSGRNENEKYYSTIVPTQHSFSNTAIPALTISSNKHTSANQSGDSVISSLTSHTARTADASTTSTSTEQSDERSDVRM